MSSRESTLATIRAALGHKSAEPAPDVPETARMPARLAGTPAAEMELLLTEISKLGGNTRSVSPSDFEAMLADLVREERIRKATAWRIPGLISMGVEQILSRLGVEILAPHAGKWTLAECDLGITGVDAALPESGTLVLDTGPDKPRAVSLLPRVHLAIVTASALRADLPEVLMARRAGGDFLFVTGPSRTADIELTLTIGVHGPKALYVWAVQPQSGD